MITPLLKPLAEAYFKLYNAQKNTHILIKHRKEEFFGMRDFYRFVVSHISTKLYFSKTSSEL